MTITVKLLEGELESLDKLIAQCEADLNQYQGARRMCAALIEALREPEEETCPSPTA